ncbi:unnamed protein product [Leuciscus chuanchicus]
MDSEDIYQNVERRDIEDTFGPQTPIRSQDEGKDEKRRGRRCLVLMTVCLGLICVLLLVFITLHITITAERDLLKSYKNTVEEFNHTIISLQDNYTDLMTEKDQLKNNFNSLSQKKLELESKVTSLSEELTREVSKRGFFFISSELKSWSESRKFCRDGGADLIIINTEEKQRRISSLVKERVWIGLSDIETEGIMKWVDNSTLKQGADQMNQLFPVLTVLCQLLCILHSNSMLLEVARKDVKPSGPGSTSWSSPACGPRIKLENGSRRMVRREPEDMAEPAGATLRSQAGCSGLARAGSKHLIGNPLGPPDVLDGSESPAIEAI